MYKVLLVEDEAAVREGIVQRIDWGAHGFVLAGACEDGRGAMRVLESGAVDVVITDINMPVMDGLALSEQIQQHWPDTIVVILTGFGDFTYAQKAIRYRVQEYILKPITARQLRELLDKLRAELDSRRAAAGQVAALMDDVGKARDLMRTQVLQKLLAGEGADEAETGMEDIAEVLGPPPYRVVVADVMAPKGEASDAGREYLQKELEKHAAEQRLETVRDENERIVLVCGGEKGAETAERMLWAAARQRGLPLSAAVGAEVETLSALAHSYAGALSAFEHTYRLPPGQMLYAEKLPPPGPRASFGDKRRAVVTAVRMLNAEQAQAELSYLVAALAEAALPRREMVHQLQKLALQLSEYAEEEGIQPQAASAQLESGIVRSCTLGEGVEMLRQYMNEALEHGTNRGDAASRQGAVAVEYIKENYMDPELSLQRVTQHLSVSTSYFSTLFKNYTGVTFVEFLTQLRMDKAQELLMTTDCKNYEIAARVGYDDPGYFGSTFKKATGFSPSEYRKRYRK